MRKSSICKISLVLLLMGILVFGSKKQEEPPRFLPEAKNDFIFTVIGGDTNDGRTDTLNQKNQ